MKRGAAVNGFVLRGDLGDGIDVSLCQSHALDMETQLNENHQRQRGQEYRNLQANGQTRSMVLLMIQLLSSALRNFISSRTTVTAWV